MSYKNELLSIYPLFKMTDLDLNIILHYENINKKIEKQIEKLPELKLQSKGMSQLGNTCYFVSLMQILYHTNMLTRYILNYQMFFDKNKEIDIIYNLFNLYQKTESIKITSSNKEYTEFYNKYHVGQYGTQQDSIELFNDKIFNKFSELFDLRDQIFINKLSMNNKKYKGNKKLDIPRLYLGKLDPQSIMSYLFDGIYQSDLIFEYKLNNNIKKKIKSKFETKNVIEVELQTDNKNKLDNLMEILNNFFKKETLTDKEKDPIRLVFKGNNINTVNERNKKGKIYSEFGKNKNFTNQNILKQYSATILPNILIISFKRFDNYGRKIMHNVQIKEKFTIKQSDREINYITYGAIFHHGSGGGGGHYTSFIRDNLNNPNSTYTHYNDSTVTKNINCRDIYNDNIGSSTNLYIIFCYKEDFLKKYAK